MQKITRDWDYWAYWFRVTHRESIPGIDEYDEQLVNFILAALELEPGASLLDLACGSGVHGVRLAQRAIQVTGVDISPSLVAYANELARAAGVSNVGFVLGDMRVSSCHEAHDAVTILSQSFGFFGPQGDMAVLHNIRTALRPGGRFLLDLNDPAQLQKPGKSWQELDGGFLLSETSYDPLDCVYTNHFYYIDSQGRVNTAAEPERIWVYTLPQLRRMIADARLTVDAVYGKMSLPLTPYSAACRQRRFIVGSKP